MEILLLGKTHRGGIGGWLHSSVIPYESNEYYELKYFFIYTSSHLLFVRFVIHINVGHFLHSGGIIYELLSSSRKREIDSLRASHITYRLHPFTLVSFLMLV
jgi:hypothetical protein